MVHGPVAERADEVVIGLPRRLRKLHERPEDVMDHVLRLRVAEAQGAAIEHQLCRALIVKARRPVGAGGVIAGIRHFTDKTPVPGGFVFRNSGAVDLTARAEVRR